VAVGVFGAGARPMALKSIERGVGIATVVYFAATVIALLVAGAPLLTVLSGLVAVAYVLFTSLMVLLAGRGRLPALGGGLEQPQHA
jgi:hypothetical protein